MRLLYIIDSVGVGGAETLLLGLIAAARSRGHEVHLAYFTPGPLADRMQALAASVTRLSTRGLKDPRALPRTLRLIRRLRPDVVHTHLTKSDLIGQLAARLAGVGERIITLHNTDPWRKNRIASLIYRIVTAGVDHLVAVSDEVADYTATTGGAPRDRITVIRNGVDIARFTPRQRGGFATPPRVAVIGRLQPQKDHATFLQALAILQSHGVPPEVLIVGDGPLMADLRARATALGVTVTFTGNQGDIPALLATLDIVVQSSAWEGLPMVLLEAMASGLPVVATAVGETPRLVDDGRNGLLVPARSPDALASALHRLLTDPALALALGAAARRTVESGYTDAVMFDRIFALYGKARSSSALA